MSWWFVAVPVALGGWLLIKGRAKLYQELLSDDHLQELASLAESLRQEANQTAGQPVEQPPHRISSLGLTVAYHLTPEETNYRAHLSLSHKGGWFAAFAAGFLAAYLRRCLGASTPPAPLGVSSRGVYHLTLSLTALSEQPTLPALPTLRDECLDEARSLTAGLRQRLPE